MEERSLLIVGGGLAGLSAGVQLAQKGVRVKLVEKRQFFGGRTHSRIDKHTGQVIDNCPHVLTTNYRHVLDYLKTIGTDHYAHFPDQLEMLFRNPKLGAFWFRAPKIPSPAGGLGGLVAFANLKNLSLADKLCLVKVSPKLIAAVIRNPKRLSKITADEWFKELKLTQGLRESFWDWFVIGCTNEKPYRVSAWTFVQALRWAFANRDMGSLGYLTTDLDSAVVTPAIEYIESHGGEVITAMALEEIKLDAAQQVSSLRFKSGVELQADGYILALPPKPLGRLIKGSELADTPFFSKVLKIENAPIVGVNLWFDQPLKTKSAWEGLLGTTIEMLFDHTRIKQHPTDKGYYYTVGVSAAWEVEHMNKETFTQLALDDLAKQHPESRHFKLLASSVFKDPYATFSAVPGFEQLPCSQKTPISNLFLAGDWTDTELPSTLEAAVFSGVKAANEVSKARLTAKRNGSIKNQEINSAELEVSQI